MALVTQDVTPDRLYSPFEGMSEAQRLTNSSPRGMLRFEFEGALDAKPVNDDILLNITGSLPPNFAYILSSVSFNIDCDTCAQWDPECQFRMRNGIPGGALGNEQWALFNFPTHRRAPATAQRTLVFDQGTIRDWFPQPLWPQPGGFMSFTLRASNGNNDVQAAGLIFFHMAFYQYDLNQAVRYPLNSPVPVGIR